MTTIIFIVILAFFTWRGYQKGFAGTVSGVLSFVIAYPAAIFFTKPFATFLRTHIALDGLILFLVAGSTIFVVVSLVVSLLIHSLARLAPSNSITNAGSKIGGVVFGIIIGGVFGLIAVYVVDLVVKPTAPDVANQPAQSGSKASDSKAPSSKAPSSKEAESIRQYVVAGGAPVQVPVKTLAQKPAEANNTSFINSAAKNLVSTAASTAVGIITSDKSSSQLAKNITQDPQAMLNHVQNMTNNGEVKALLNDPEFQAELNHGNVQSLMQNPDFKQLLKNPDMQAIISSSDDPKDKSAEQAVAKMIQAWQKVVTLKTDPRVVDIVSDPAFQAQLNSPNKLPLLMNPKMRELSEIIFSEGVASSASTSVTKTPAQLKPQGHYSVEDITEESGSKATVVEPQSHAEKSETQPEVKIYRWTDENGKVHYSDKPLKN